MWNLFTDNKPNTRLLLLYAYLSKLEDSANSREESKEHIKDEHVIQSSLGDRERLDLQLFWKSPGVVTEFWFLHLGTLNGDFQCEWLWKRNQKRLSASAVVFLSTSQQSKTVFFKCEFRPDTENLKGKR